MDTLLPQRYQHVHILKVDFMDEKEGVVTFLTKRGIKLSAYFWNETFYEGQKVNVEFNHLEFPLSWNTVFSENKDQKIAVETTSNECSYFCYGKILSINPIIADFGDLQLSVGDWTQDEKIIGEFIYWKIDRLDIKNIQST